MNLKNISTSENMQTWLEELENAEVILPADEWTWWQCPDCYHQGYHTGYHYRTMLRKPVKIDSNLATVLRDLAVEKDLESLESHLYKIWEKTDNKNFSKWMSYHVEPWQMIKAASQTIIEAENE